VVLNNLPAIRGVVEQQREDPIRIAAVLLRAVQVEVTDNVRPLPT
jgi:hypothetical protein